MASVPTTVASAMLLAVLLLLATTGVLGQRMRGGASPASSGLSQKHTGDAAAAAAASLLGPGSSSSRNLTSLAIITTVPSDPCANAGNGFSYTCNPTCSGSMKADNAEDCSFCLVDSSFGTISLNGIITIVSETAISVDISFNGNHVLTQTVSGNPPTLSAPVPGISMAGISLSVDVAAADLTTSGNIVTGFTSSGTLTVGFSVSLAGITSIPLGSRPVATYKSSEKCHGYGFLIGIGVLFVVLVVGIVLISCCCCCGKNGCCCSSNRANQPAVAMTQMNPIAATSAVVTSVEKAHCPSCQEVVTIPKGSIIGNVMACGHCKAHFATP